MSGATETVAALEVEAVQAASAAVVAEAAAEVTALSAAMQIAQVTEQAAAQILETTAEVENLEDEQKWMRTQLQAMMDSQGSMAAQMLTLHETNQQLLAALTLLNPVPVVVETTPPENVDGDGLPVAEPASAIPIPVPPVEKKRRRFL